MQKKDADQSNSVCAAQGHGAWVFEGYLHTRQAFVGQWHSTPDPVNGARMEGVFCMSKFDSQRPDVVVRYVKPMDTPIIPAANY